MTVSSMITANRASRKFRASEQAFLMSRRRCRAQGSGGQSVSFGLTVHGSVPADPEQQVILGRGLDIGRDGPTAAAGGQEERDEDHAGAHHTEQTPANDLCDAKSLRGDELLGHGGGQLGTPATGSFELAFAEWPVAARHDEPLAGQEALVAGVP